MKFITLKFRNLINAEFYQFLFLVLEIIDKLGVSKLKVTNKRNEFSSIVVRLLNALNREIDTTLTKELTVLNKERSSAFSGLTSFVNGMLKSPNAETKAQAIVIKNYLKTLGKQFGKKNLQEKTALLTKLVEDFSKNTNLIAALVEIKVQDFITEIDTKNKFFIAKYEARNAIETANESDLESFVSIRPEAIKSLASLQKLLLGRYETNIEDKVDNNDIITAIEQVNQLIDKYNQLVKSSVSKKSKIKNTTAI